ncbi:MAG: hypothetical protein HKUEN02_09400 [Anaerolineaceae bacterium]|nr:MAG: hypothetical protein HKUEN02_09400 [Anaerolineaceae bacterium]
MKSVLAKTFQKPIYLLLAVNILIGLLTFHHYGLSWDEPLFYDYADALGYAYSPREWFSGNFDLENSYGPSAEDHKTRGAAYLFLARNFVYGLEAFGSDSASAWHLVNFLFFQLGVYFIYRLMTRWMKPSAALAATAFFSYQPLLWGHAFINPKDPPFLVFFLASVCLGFELADNIEAGKSNPWKITAAAVCLGIATSIRILGPLAGMLVVAYALIGNRKNLKGLLRPLAAYALIAIAVMFVTWPYLWESPFARIFQTLRFMSNNPTQLAVLFNGEIFRANNMPRRYLPFMLWSTLTEPTWLLFAVGAALGFWKLRRKPKEFAALTLTLGWFVALIAYVFIRRPAIYDGARHFLFILPPVFICIGFAFEALLDKFSSATSSAFWLRAVLVALAILPGLSGIIRLHPYEYAYYNSFVGGVSGVFRVYETEYWLTCYKEALETLDTNLDQPANVFVPREAYIAAYYAGKNTTVHDTRNTTQRAAHGDYVLVSTRANGDRSAFRDAPTIIQIRRGNAVFCEVKQVP